MSDSMPQPATDERLKTESFGAAANRIPVGLTGKDPSLEQVGRLGEFQGNLLVEGGIHPLRL